MKHVVIFCAVAVILAASGVTQASITLSQWAANPTQTVGDKIFTFVSSTLPTNSTIGFSEPAQTVYFTVGFDGGNMQATGQYLNYTVAINQTVSPLDVFVSASMDTSWITGSTTVTTTIFEPNPDVVLTSVNGYPSALATIPGNLTLLTVRDVYTGGGYLVNETTAFTQFTTPEPATLALLTVGALALLKRRT
jgi:hypothetical protein